MDFVMDLQLFGGGGESQTTSREIPDQSANEKALENFLLDSASLGGNMAPYAYQAFAGSLNDLFLPDFNKLYDQARQTTERYAGAYNNYLGDWLSDYTGQVDKYGGLYDAALNKFNTDTDRYLSDYTGKMDKALAAYNEQQAKRSPLWDDLVNGILPSQYATNRQAALNADLKGTMGSAINNLASRGVINSGVGNKALDDISQSASDTLAKRYADDLQLEASLLGQDRANARDAYDVASSNAGNIFNNQFTTAQGQFGNADKTYSTMLGNYGNLAGTKTGTANSWIGNELQAFNQLHNQAMQGQAASFNPSSQFLSYAGTLGTPTSNLYNTMYSGRMGTGSTTTTHDDGGAGMWSAVGGLGAAAIQCFTGDTLVTTPDGYKAIRDIEVGDEVLSVRDGKVAAKKVERISTPQDKCIVDVFFTNGTVWHTTDSQRYFDGKHFNYCDGGENPAMVLNGKPAKIAAVEDTGRVETVYDITLEGFAGENIFFANDVAAEGFGD